MDSINPDILEWTKTHIIPRYDMFDKGHRRDHANVVIKSALELSEFYDIDKNMLIVAAACHDLGLSVGREFHHLESGRIIREMKELHTWFTDEQIETIAQAAEDHRASLDHEPRSIYGKIIAEADRLIIPDVVIRRAIQYSLKNWPEQDYNFHWQTTAEHLESKYAKGGYLKLWIPQSPNSKRLEELRDIIKDKSKLESIFKRIYNEETTLQ